MTVPHTPSVKSGMQSKKRKKRSEGIRVGGGVFTNIRKNEDIHELLSSQYNQASDYQNDKTGTIED